MKVLTAVALMCVLPSLARCTSGGSASATGASATAAVPPESVHVEPATPAAAASTMKIPLVQGLTVIGAASERQGDYEASTAVDWNRTGRKRSSVHLG